MAKTILVCGFGPGISTAVAERFGADGYSVALVARNGERLAEGVKALEAKGIEAAAFAADLGDVEAIPALGPIAALQWSAYSGGAGDRRAATATDLAATIGHATSSLLVAVG